MFRVGTVLLLGSLIRLAQTLLFELLTRGLSLCSPDRRHEKRTDLSLGKCWYQLLSSRQPLNSLTRSFTQRSCFECKIGE